MEQEEKIRCQKEYEIEQQNVEQIYKKRQKFLTKSAENFMTALSLSIEDESVVPRLVAMLIQNTDNKELIGLVTVRLHSHVLADSSNFSGTTKLGPGRSLAASSRNFNQLLI